MVVKGIAWFTRDVWALVFRQWEVVKRGKLTNFKHGICQISHPKCPLFGHILLFESFLVVFWHVKGTKGRYNFNLGTALVNKFGLKLVLLSNSVKVISFWTCAKTHLESKKKKMKFEKFCKENGNETRRAMSYETLDVQGRTQKFIHRVNNFIG